eukprot:CAMPEP_0197185458 /NCGR_PEP_ID=MMETSP1423-20130617/11979_1 /TAXON_ID=476441 /ORGANISM="Pseudo-nitzschia heimii, Strain UNC1101" /LENGTH=455 /DNA_ID=CAMNT_0042636525 /DNA_START=83 /DNA_END=1450 /DNA_ORIENTATION=-
MIQSKRRLSRQPGLDTVFLKRNLPFIVKGCTIFTTALVFLLNYRFAISTLSGSIRTFDSSVSKRDEELQSMQLYPDNLPTTQSSIDEWQRQTQRPMVGSYRYSSIATIQLPTIDLEEQNLSPKPSATAGFDSDRDRSNVDDDVVALTRKGHKYNQEDGLRTPNQDRVLVLKRNNNNIDGDKDWWMGLFDGHGFYGHFVSQFVSSEFSRQINKLWEGRDTMRSSKMVKDKLRAMFHEVNRSIPDFMRSAGCTGISILKKGNLLYISNIGDSVAFVSSFDKSNTSQKNLKIIYETKPHKPDTPSERKRIEDKGGRVMDPPFPGASARLMIPVKVGFQTFEYGLAMSRSFGDLDGEEFGLSIEPDTDVLDLSKLDKNQEYVVVAATDGLIDFDKLSEVEVASAMANALASTEENTNGVLSSPGLKAAKELILKSSKLWDSGPGNYRDDISIVALKLRV